MFYLIPLMLQNSCVGVPGESFLEEALPRAFFVPPVKIYETLIYIEKSGII